MRTIQSVTVTASLLCISACGPTTNSNLGSEPVVNYVGGWDGADTRGSSVLVLRDDLRGTLTSSMFGDAVHDYRVSYEVMGEIDSANMLQMRLACVEAGRAEVIDDPSAGDDLSPEQEWAGIDCSGWELGLACTLAGDCDSGGGCNMICDIVDFGDAYALSGLTLESVEDQFDMWHRV